MLLENAEHVIFISQRVQEWFSQRMHFRQPPRLIPNGVDRALFYPPAAGERELARQQSGFASETPLLLFVGRFTSKKGLHFIQKLAAARPQWNFLLIGTGELSPSSWKLPNVHVLPPQPQSTLRGFYLAADLLLLPSVGEGVPLVVQEAMTCGLPAALSAETASSLPNAPLIILDIQKLDKSLPILDSYLNEKLKMSTLRISVAEYACQWDWNRVAEEYEILFTAYL
jgi:glycosyltransferase involved in cell wall biosynthesis